MSNQVRKSRGPSIMFPIILITTGVLLLLTNLNILDFDVWNMVVKFWPVIIIGMGLDLIFGRRVNFGHFIIIGLIILFAFGNRDNRVIFSNNDIITETVSVDLPDSSAAEIDVNFGVGQLNFSSGNDAMKLLTGRLDVLEGYEIEEVNRDGDVYSYELGMKDNYQAIHFQVDVDVSWDIEINEDFPVYLNIDAGVGEVWLGLSDLNLLDLDLDLGVGEVTVYLPGTGDYDVDIDGGIGELTVNLPESIGARIIIDTGLGSFSVPSSYTKNGNVYTNDLYSSSENQVDIRISAGLGSVTVVELP